MILLSVGLFIFAPWTWDGCFGFRSLSRARLSGPHAVVCCMCSILSFDWSMAGEPRKRGRFLFLVPF